MEQADRRAILNLVLGTVLGVILSRFTFGSIFMTVPILLACRAVRQKGAKLASFALMLVAVLALTIIQNRVILPTEYWPVLLVGLYLPVGSILGAAVWTFSAERSGSLMRRFFWACIPVFVLGLLLSIYFALDASLVVRTAMVESVVSYFPSDALGVDITSLAQVIVNSMMLVFTPIGMVFLALPIVISDINLNRYDEQWQYDFANMKLPDPYIWVFFASWALALISNFVTAMPAWMVAISWNCALSLTCLYFVVGVSIVMAFARKRTAAVTAGRIVLLVVLLCILPMLNMITFAGLSILGILETWIRFRG